MEIKEIISELEEWAPPAFQENYDNSRLITGNSAWECKGILCCLDAVEAVIDEAIEKGCNLIVAHHPIVFQGLKTITGKNYVERTIIKAIKNDIAIYAFHTNLDAVISGVSGKMAAMLQLENLSVLAPKKNWLSQITTFVPLAHAEVLRTAIFKSGAGQLGNYSECTFNTQGIGTFKPLENANPVIGEIGKREEVEEMRIEFILPTHSTAAVLAAIKLAHPYEEIAYFQTAIENTANQTGFGAVGDLPENMSETDFLNILKDTFALQVIKHTELGNRKVKRIALCGGAGISLLPKAIAAGADVYITADIKYHEFFDADNNILLADIGHYESEQYTINLIIDFLAKKFTTFAILKTGLSTNPVQYWL